jgi:hypothetical protein
MLFVFGDWRNIQISSRTGKTFKRSRFAPISATRRVRDAVDAAGRLKHL